MSNSNFLREYSQKIKALQPNVSASASDWDLLENRMNHLDRNRKRRYVFFFILLALGFVLGGIYLYELKSGANNHPDVSGTVVETIRKNTDVEQNPSTESTANLKDSDSIEEYGKYDTFAKINRPTDRLSNNDVKYTLKSVLNKKQSKVKHTPLPDNKTAFPENVISSEHGKVDIREKSTIDIHSAIEDIKLPDFNKEIKWIQIESDISKLNPTLSSVDGLVSEEVFTIRSKKSLNIVFPKVKSVSINSMKYFVKIDGGLITATDANSTGMSGPLVFTGHEVTKNMGFQNSINLQIAPNDKWKYSVGVNRSQFMHHGSHTASLRLMDGVCLNPTSSDPKEYAFSYIVTNGRSSSTINLKLSEEHPGAPLDSTEVFQIDMGMHIKTVSWAIPITAERKLYSKGDWSFFAKGGISLGFASYSKEEITHFSESCANLCFNQGFSPTVSSQKSNQIATGIILGTSAEWHLSPKISLVVNPEMNTNIKMLNGEHNGSLKWGLNMGALYLLK